MPYPLLLGTQLLILAWMMSTAWRVTCATVQPSRKSGRLLLGVATAMAKLLPSIHYPAAMVAAFSLFAALQAAGMPLVVSTYVPVLLVAALVAWLELRQPSRDAWRPATREVRTDLTFMIVVQLALPPMVGIEYQAKRESGIHPLNAASRPASGSRPPQKG